MRELALVRVVGPDGDGWGECAALPEPTYSAEYVEGAVHVLTHHLAPRLLGRGPLAAADVAGALAPVRGHPMARAALEVAVVDAQLRAEGRSLAQALGAERREVPAGVAVGLARSVPELVATVERHVVEGYGRVKLKVQPGWDREPLSAVRSAFPDLLLVADANGSYRRDDARHLAALDDLGLTALEQPLPEDDLLGHAALAGRLSTPIALDESLTSLEATRLALWAGACRAVVVKPGRLGGLGAALAVHELCRQDGVAAWVGGMLGSAVGRAVDLALAALPGFTLPGDVSATSRYVLEDLDEAVELHEGNLWVPAGPGIGARPRPGTTTLVAQVGTPR